MSVLKDTIRFLTRVIGTDSDEETDDRGASRENSVGLSKHKTSRNDREAERGAHHPWGEDRE